MKYSIRRSIRASMFSTAASLLAVLLAGSVSAGPGSDPDLPMAASQEPAASLEYYLPAGLEYDPAVPKPSAVLGWEVGTWHVRHDQLVRYMERVAESSDRVEMTVFGHTHEQRPLVQLTISSPANLERLEDIRQRHADLADPSTARGDLSDLPLIVNLGYSVHGNEPSGSNASLLAAYHLAAAQDPVTLRWLEETVIVLDPSLNPDGLSRFAQWVNMHKGRVPVAASRSREHVEGWPSGRTNHYWFDLNRDWLLAQHPESQGRLERFHHWRPNVLTDFHEMGTNSTYFFQPGIPIRKNPLTPDRNVELTEIIGEYHARTFDRVGVLYYSEERFDDFYFGKGSTYPDLQGAVGILFEQASSRGHVQDSTYGGITFPFTIRNQFLTTLSTLEASVDRRQELLEYRAEFFEEALELASQDDLVGWIFGDPEDPVRTYRMVELLRRHHIEVRRPTQDVDLGRRQYPAGSSWIVPLAQPQYRLVRSLFERRIEFADSAFYDVSTWTLPLAFDMPHDALERGRPESWIGNVVDAPEWPTGSHPKATADGEQPYAWLFEWQDFYAPRALHRLLDAGVFAQAATQTFTAVTHGGERKFASGTIVVPQGLQTLPADKLEELWKLIVEEDGLEVHVATTGLTPKGSDLGSPGIEPLSLPKPAILVGRGVDAYAAGELWHLLDHRFEMPVALLDLEVTRPQDLEPFTHLLLADGDYGRLRPEMVEAVVVWVRQGGILVTSQKGSRWAEQHVLVNPAEAPGASPEKVESAPAPSSSAKVESVERLPYGAHRGQRAKQLIRGTIFEADLDLTHPLAYGYTDPRLPVFRTDSTMLRPSSDPYATVAVYTGDPLLSGYVSSENLERLRRTPALIAERVQRGAVIRMADRPNFRSYWYGTNRLLMNSLFFGSLIDNTQGSGRPGHH